MKKLRSNPISEITTDIPTRLRIQTQTYTVAQKHFHKNVELFGVVEGQAEAIISDEKRILHVGDMMAVNPCEMHKFTIMGESKVRVVSIGLLYMSTFYSVFPKSKLPRYMTDVKFNRAVFDSMPNVPDNNDLSDMRKYAIVNDIIAAIVDRYGVAPGAIDAYTSDMVENVVSYIYEHYAEDLSLKTLGDRFGMTATALSKKLSGYIGTDLRAFINDVRAINASFMINDPSNRNVPLKDIAFRCGFKSPETFYRVYARNFGDNMTVQDR